MSDLMVIVVATSLLSSLFTLALVALLFKKVAQPKLQAYIEKTLLPEFREQVNQGGQDAGEALLPRFRKAVNDGFQDAIREAPSEFFDDATKSVSKTIESGLDVLLGKR